MAKLISATLGAPICGRGLTACRGISFCLAFTRTTAVMDTFKNELAHEIALRDFVLWCDNESAPPRCVGGNFRLGGASRLTLLGAKGYTIAPRRYLGRCRGQINKLWERRVAARARAETFA